MTWIQTIVSCGAIAIGGMLILGFRDRARSKRLVKQVREKLKSREGFSDSELALEFPLQREKEIALKFRERLSKALGIESEKIRPGDDLHRDYHLDTIGPFLVAAIASEFTRDPAKTGPQRALKFKDGQTTFSDFVRAISQQST